MSFMNNNLFTFTVENPGTDSNIMDISSDESFPVASESLFSLGNPLALSTPAHNSDFMNNHRKDADMSPSDNNPGFLRPLSLNAQVIPMCTMASDAYCNVYSLFSACSKPFQCDLSNLQVQRYCHLLIDRPLHDNEVLGAFLAPCQVLKLDYQVRKSPEFTQEVDIKLNSLILG